MVLYVCHWFYKSIVQGKFEAIDLLVMIGLPILLLVLSILMLTEPREKNEIAILSLLMICVMFTRFGQLLAYLEFTIY
ncbi:hypothetical protein [Salibacterium aidingense]|uniref:hypothetical protein n=1 Tax=Salibacterium aidingense TaxID=384933 RepID=UPI003BDA90B9